MGGGQALIGADGSVLWERCSIASTPLRRMRGLLGKRRLEPGEALLLRPCPSVHTFFMKFPIDVVFVSRGGEVAKIVNELRPWRAAWCAKAHTAIEVGAGEAARRGLRVGDRVTVAATPGADASADPPEGALRGVA